MCSCRRIAPRQSKNAERVPKEHFAKQRLVDYTQTVHGDQGVLGAKLKPSLLFTHAPKNGSDHGLFDKTAASTMDGQSAACVGPSTLDRPNRPMKQSKILEMMDSEIRHSEHRPAVP
jgi:hypothetical protein